MSENVEAEVSGIAAGVSSLQEGITLMTDLLEQISDGLFYLNLHVGAKVTPWVPDEDKGTESDVLPRHGHGRVKWFDATKGFGFITLADAGDDVFVHCSAIQANDSQTLSDNQMVEFNIVPGPHGPMAENVRLVGQ